MTELYYIGLDVHKKTIAYCIKEADGQVVEQGTLRATGSALSAWARSLQRPWIGGLEATMFSGWIYDHLQPYAQQLQVAHPVMLKAIACAKKKNDRIDAAKISDLLRCDLLPQCYMAPSWMRELRRVLRFRNLLVRQCVRMKNKTAGLLMEVGAEYNQKKLHGKKYFQQLVESLELPPSLRQLLGMSRTTLQLFDSMQRQLVQELASHPALLERVALLATIPAVGDVLALSWVLEVGEVQRFRTRGQAVSYCGLSSALRSSGGQQRRGPISKQRNRHLQTMLIEGAQLAPRWNPQLAAVYAREIERGHRNRATLAVARKLVAYLLAVDRSGKPFELRPQPLSLLLASIGSGPGTAQGSAAPRCARP